MTTDTHSATRRTALAVIAGAGALATIPAVAALPNIGDTAEWDRALGTCERAEAAWQTYHRDVIEPAHARYEQIVGRYPVRVYPKPTPEEQARIDAAAAAYDPLEKRFDELVTLHYHAVEALILTPSPTVAALAAKLRIAGKNEVFEWNIGATLMAVIIEDASRLAKREA